MEVPQWEEVHHKKSQAGTELDPLERFVYDYTPVVSAEADEFRDDLTVLVQFLTRSN